MLIKSAFIMHFNPGNCPNCKIRITKSIQCNLLLRVVALISVENVDQRVFFYLGYNEK